MNLPLIYADLHWSESSSIVRQQGKKYTVRLEHLIDTVNHIEQHATDIGSDTIIMLGDAFDKSVLTAQEITALQDIRFNQNIRHVFLVGNHEISKKSLAESTVHLFRLVPNCIVVDTPTSVIEGDTEYCFLPYIAENDRKAIEDYFGPKTRHRVILSHNDIKGEQMGNFISQVGFNIENIYKNCDFFFNGHLHNKHMITQHIVNVGNICGQNFGEDAKRYSHSYIIYDQDKKTYEEWENPYALNFYKLNFSSIDSLTKELENLLPNPVLTVQVSEDIATLAKERLSEWAGIVSFRVITTDTTKEKNVQEEKLIQLNHIDSFRQYMLDALGDSDIVKQELQEVLK